VGGKGLQRQKIWFVELVDPELGQHDRTGRLRAVPERHGQDRLIDVRRAGDRDREVAVSGIREVERFTGGHHPTGDALTDLHDQGFHGLAPVLGAVAAESDRDQCLSVDRQQVHPTVVIVDQGPKLRGERGADLLDVVQSVQPHRQGVHHPQLGARPHRLATTDDAGNRRSGLR